MAGGNFVALIAVIRFGPASESDISQSRVRAYQVCITVSSSFHLSISCNIYGSIESDLQFKKVHMLYILRASFLVSR